MSPMKAMYRILSEHERFWVHGLDLPPEYARLWVHGPDARRFLQGMLTNDVQGLQSGEGCQAVLLTVKGKMLSDLVVYDCGDGFLLVFVQHAKPQVLESLQRHLIMDDAAVEDVSASMAHIGVYGGNVGEVLGQVLRVPTDALPRQSNEHHLVPYLYGTIRLAVSQELGSVGYHVFGFPDQLAEFRRELELVGASCMPASLANRLRIDSGVPLYGVDMDQDRLPMESRLDAAIHFSKGCYLGQEVVVRVSSRGHVNRKLMGLRFPAGGDPPLLGSNLIHETRENAGTVMSGTHSDLFGTIALGYVHRTLWDPGTRLYVAERGVSPMDGLPIALVCDLPFLR